MAAAARKKTALKRKPRAIPQAPSSKASSSGSKDLPADENDQQQNEMHHQQHEEEQPVQQKPKSKQKKVIKAKSNSRQQTIGEALNHPKAVTPTRGSPRRVAQQIREEEEEEEQKEETEDAKEAEDERQVLNGSYLSSAANTTELGRRLKTTWKQLQRFANQQQEDIPLEQLQFVCAELLHEKIMDHGEKNVRSLAACCLVELLRLYAPDMPFKTNEDLYDAFQLILDQLRCLAIDDPNGNDNACDLHYFYVLESLATVKSCLLVVGMDFTPEEEDEPLMVQLFKAFFETIRKEHSTKIENHMLSIMASCIEESDVVDQRVLDTILLPLVTHSEVVSTTTSNSNGKHTSSSNGDQQHEQNATNDADMGKSPYRLACKLILRTSEHLQAHISRFINSVLVGVPSSITNESELSEQVYELIYELHKINPSLLLYVLPNVCMQLQVDEVPKRSDAIALMARLFASSHADYGHEYMRTFRDFLGRFRDVNKEIRLQMLQVCAIIWERKPELAKSIEKEFLDRLSDPEWDVRRLAVNEICDLAANNLDLVSEEILKQVGERMKDKKVVLRKETMTGLSQVYATHVAAYWAQDQTDDQPANAMNKLYWIPDYVLKCFAYPQQELRLRVVQLLDDFLLSKNANEEVRAFGLLFIYRHLDSSSIEALRRILQDRAKCLRITREFLKLKQASRQASHPSLKSKPQGTNRKNAVPSFEVDEYLELEENAKKLMESIGPLFMDGFQSKKLVDQLWNWKDQSVFKYLDILCDPSKTQEETRKARDSLVKSVGSKTPLGEFLKSLCRKMNMLTINGQVIGVFLELLRGNKTETSKKKQSQMKKSRLISPTKQNVTGCMELLVLASQVTPQMFGAFVGGHALSDILTNAEAEDADDDQTMHTKQNKQIALVALEILANYFKFWRKEAREQTQLETPPEPVKKLLHEICLHASAVFADAEAARKAAKSAAISVCCWFGDSKETSTLITRLCTKKMLAGTDKSNRSSSAKTRLRALQSLEAFTKHCSGCFNTSESLTSTLWTLLEEHYWGDDAEIAGAKISAVQIAEMKCLAFQTASNLIVFCHRTADEDQLETRSKQLNQKLFDLLRSDGKEYTSNSNLACKYRQVACSALLKMLRGPRVESLLSVTDWHMLGFVMQDSHESVRTMFLKKLTSHLVKRTVPHPQKYLSYLALAATEPDAKLKRQAKAVLLAAVQRMREMFEVASAKNHGNDQEEAVSTEDDGTESMTAHNLHALMVPEYGIPYVVHLLAHHPDFPVDSKAATEWMDQVQYLNFFLDGLVSTQNASEADNISFLLQICARLSQSHDVLNPNSRRIYSLGDCFVKLLRKRIKNPSNLKSFPGKIYLPKQLFAMGKVCQENSKAQQAKRPSLESGDEVADLAALLSASKQRKVPRISTSLSPIKAMDSFSSGREVPFRMSTSPSSLTASRKRKASPSSRKTKASKGKIADSPSTSKLVVTPRRSTPTRRARTTKSMAEQESGSEEDSDDFVPNASVASRANKKNVGKATRKRRASAQEEEVQEEQEEEMSSFRTRRRRSK